MKKLSDLMELIAIAIEQNNEKKHWFISYSGHVNLIDVRLYPNGWSNDLIREDGTEVAEFKTKKCYLEDQESVQEMYYWIAFKLDDI